MTNQTFTIEKIQLQGFRAYLRLQTIQLTRKKKPLSLAIFGHNAKGKSSLVDSFEYFFSKDATLKRLGKREVNAYAGPKAVEHVDAKDEGIESFVHFWFNRNGDSFDSARFVPSPITDEAKRILSATKIPFVIRGYDLRGFVEETTPEQQYKELVIWFGLEPLLDIQKNFRTLKRRVKERSESILEADVRARDLLRETDGIVAKWSDPAVCNWLNDGILASLDSTLVFDEFSEEDPAFATLVKRWKAEQEKLGLTQLRKISSLLEDLVFPLDRTNGEVPGKIHAFEHEVERLRLAERHEKEERSRLSAAVFNKVWTETKKLMDRGEVQDICPICDSSFASGTHESRDGVRISIDKKLSDLATYRKSEKELETSTTRVNAAVESLKRDLDALNLVLIDTSYASSQVGNYIRELDRWRINEEHPVSQKLVGELSNASVAIADQISQIEGQQGEHTYRKALDKVNSLLDIKTDLQRIARTKDELTSLQIELDRQVLEIEKAIVEYIDSLIGKLESDIESIYQDIQGTGGTSPPIRLELADQSGTGQQTAQLLVDYSDNRQGVAPSGYLSDSQVHTLALALRLAAIRMFNSEAPILVLDDVVTSYDIDHRKTIVGALEKHFSAFQIILVTHDEQFFNLLKDQMPGGRWFFKRILKIQDDFGPVFDDHLTSDEDIQSKLDAGEDAGVEIRLAEEAWLLQICLDFCVKVDMRSPERALQFERAELANSLASFLKGARIKIPQMTSQSNRFLSSLQSGVVENLSSHFLYNPYKSRSVGDEKARWEEFKRFRELFKCPQCEGKRFTRPRGLDIPVCKKCETKFAFSQS